MKPSSSPDSISRKRILNGTAALVGVRYHSSECQIITLAADAQVSYWEVLDGAEVRHLILGQHSSVTALDMAPDGEKFVTGTQTSLVKVLIIGYFFLIGYLFPHRVFFFSIITA